MTIEADKACPYKSPDRLWIFQPNQFFVIIFVIISHWNNYGGIILEKEELRYAKFRIPLEFNLKYTGIGMKMVNIQNLHFISLHLKYAKFIKSAKTLVNHEFAFFFAFLCVKDDKYLDSGWKLSMSKSV